MDAGTKTTRYIGEEEDEDNKVQEEGEEEVLGGYGGRRKDKPHQPVVISVQTVRIKPGEEKGKTDGWFPQLLTYNTCRVCTEHRETKLPIHSLCATRD